MRFRLPIFTALLSLTAAWSAPAQNAAPAAPLAPDTSWVTRCVVYEVNIRDFSLAGNLRGVTAGLGRIQAAGANVIWLMPVHPVGVEGRKGPLGSPYAVRDYDAIDPAFGTAADLHALVRAAHARGMKVIIDWVPDHTSPDNPWVKDHPDFYYHDSLGRPSVPRDLQGHLTDWTDVVQLDYASPALRTAMIAELRHWLVDFDLDGFRQDVAHFIPLDFWREANTELRAAVKRPILLLAEADGLDMHRVGFDLTYAWGSYGRLKGAWKSAPAQSFVTGEVPDMHRVGFDLTYAWGSYGRLKGAWKNAPAQSFVTGEVPDMQAMPAGGMRMRFTTNHDETAWDRPPIVLFGGEAGARAAFVAEALLPGRPLLYNGQEVESPQRDSLFTREAIRWNQPHAVAAREFYRRVVHLARTDPSFLAGAFAPVTTSSPDSVIAYRRGQDVVLVNARAGAVRVTVTGFTVRGSRDLLAGRVERSDTLSLPAYGAVVLQAARTSPRE